MLVPINAIFGLSLVEQINLLVIFGFVMGGVTMFWLAYYLTRSWMGALVAGAIFTFSSYHFAHSIGHMHPDNPDLLLASSYQRRRQVWTLINGGPGSGIHRSTDGGETWAEITAGLPSEPISPSAC